MKVGLALGGGGARGIAHIGVLKVLEEEGIQVDAISGTSFGAIVGAMYAQNPDARQLEHRVLDFLDSAAFRRTKIFFIKRHFEEKKNKSFMTNVKSYLQKGIFWGVSLQKTSFITEANFLAQIDEVLDDGQIEETRIPFCAVATDLTNGQEIILNRGPIRRAVAASCAIPGVFPPISIDGLQLVDGGWVNQAPVSPLLDLKSDFLMAVTISEEEQGPKNFESGVDVVLRANEITRCILSNKQIEMADFVIRPKVGDIHWSDFWRFEDAMARGEKAAREAVETLKSLLWKKRVKKFLKFDA